MALSSIAAAGSKLASSAGNAAASVGRKISSGVNALKESKLGKTVTSLKKNVQAMTKDFQSQQNQVNGRVNSLEKILQGQNRNEVLKQESMKEQISIENRQLDILEQIERNTRENLGLGKQNKKDQGSILGSLLNILSTVANIRNVASLLGKGKNMLGRAGSAIANSRVGKAVSGAGSAIKNSSVGKAVASTGSAIKNSKVGSAIGRAGGSIVKGAKGVAGAVGLGAAGAAGAGAAGAGAAGAGAAGAGAAGAGAAGTAAATAATGGGGFFGWLKEGISGAVGSVKTFGSNAVQLVKDPVGLLKSQFKTMVKTFKTLPLIGSVIETIIGAFNISSIKNDPNLTAQEKKEAIGKEIGSRLGSLAGGTLLGAAGSALGPLGTALGAFLGSMGGEWLGNQLAEWMGPVGVYDFAASMPIVGDLVKVEETPTPKAEETPTPTPKPAPAAADQITPPGPPSAPQAITPDGGVITPETKDAKMIEPLASTATPSAVGTSAITGSIAAAAMGTIPSETTQTAKIAEPTPTSTPEVAPKKVKRKSMSERIFGDSMLGKAAQFATPLGLLTSAFDLFNPPEEVEEVGTPETAKTPDQKKIDTLNINANTVNVSGQMSQQKAEITPTAPTTATAVTKEETKPEETKEAKKPEQKKQTLTERMFGTGTMSKIAPFVPGLNAMMMGTKLYDMTSPIADKASEGIQGVMSNISQTVGNLFQPSLATASECIPLCDSSAMKPTPEWNSPKKNISEMLKEETISSKIKDKVINASGGNTTNIVNNSSTSSGGGGGQNYIPNEPRMSSALPDPFFQSVNSDMMNLLRC